MVRLPDEASEQIRLAPVRALRAVFTGVGQLVLASDRLRAEDAAAEAEHMHAEEDQPDSLASSNVRLSSTDARPATGGTSGASKTSKTSKTSKAAKPARATKSTAKGGGAGGGRRSGRSNSLDEPSRFRSLDLTGNVRMLSDRDIAELAADEHERRAAARTRPGAATPLPVDGYDNLSLSSLRARLRNLDAGQLETLLAYERSHAQRDDVATMFERRIAKLAGADDI